MIHTSDSYLTLARSSEGFYKEKGSKFISLAYKVYDEEEVKSILLSLRKQYHDARHHCYAYILGQDQTNYRANDDGEPNHSAGDPILGQIRSHNLTNVLIVVIRYFGGTKLGVGGLISAYKTAAAEAIASNEIIEEIVFEKITVDFEYPAMNEIMRVIKDYDLTIIEQDFGIKCHITVKVRAALVEEVNAKLHVAINGF